MKKIMDFECKQLSITDDRDFGCTIEFSDTVDGHESQSIEEIISQTGKYLLIQRSYPEDEYENDWYTVESSVAEFDFSQKDSIYIKLRREIFDFYCSGINLLIGLNLSDREFSRLGKILKSRFKGKVILTEE